MPSKKSFAMQEATAELIRRHPDAEHFILRRSSTPAGDRYWQIHGEFLGRRYSRKLDMRGEFDLLNAAEAKFLEIKTGAIDKRRNTPGLRSYLRTIRDLAMQRIDEKDVRETTREHWRRHTKTLFDWLDDHGGTVSQGLLLQFVLTTEQSSRQRRGALDAARLVAGVTGIDLKLEPKHRFKQPRPKQRPHYEDAEILEALDTVWPHLTPLARSTFAFVAITGQRAGSFFSIDPNLFGQDLQPGDPCPIRDVKRDCVGITSPTIENAWGKYLKEKPERFDEFAFDRREQPDDTLNRKINNKTSDLLTQLRRKASDQHYKILQFRSLRANATVRLMRMGVQTIWIAKSLSTSERMIEATYSTPAGDIASREIGKAFGRD